MVARSRHSGGCGRPGRGVHRAGAGAGGVLRPAEPMRDAEWRGSPDHPPSAPSRASRIPIGREVVCAHVSLTSRSTRQRT